MPRPSGVDPVWHAFGSRQESDGAVLPAGPSGTMQHVSPGLQESSEPAPKRAGHELGQPAYGFGGASGAASATGPASPPSTGPASGPGGTPASRRPGSSHVPFSSHVISEAVHSPERHVVFTSQGTSTHAGSIAIGTVRPTYSRKDSARRATTQPS